MARAAPGHAWKNATSLSAEYIETELKTAVASAGGAQTHKQYKKIAAVLMHFEDDDIGCDELEQKLAETFADFYGITDIIRLQLNDDPESEVSCVLKGLRAQGYTAKDCLIILVFSGHGCAVEINMHPIQGPYNVLMLGGAIGRNGRFRTEKLNWLLATNVLGDSAGDVLHILDCCYAAEGMSRNAELLAAACESASADPKRCFMNAIIEELRRMSLQPFTICTLYEEIRANRRALQLERFPFYNSRRERGSVVLGKSIGRGKTAVARMGSSNPRILLAAHLDKTMDVRDLEYMKKWLSSLLPASIIGAEIHLEGAWDSNSSILLFSLPIAVWTQINRSTTAFTYVGEVTSRNKLLQPATSGGVLSSRPPQGQENIKTREASQDK